MVTLNTRDELIEFLYGADSTSPDTLIGIATVGGELLAEAMNGEFASDTEGYITDFFPCGDEGECITVDNHGNVTDDFLYY